MELVRDATPELGRAAADLLHRRFLASQETRWLRDPSDIVHVVTFGRELTRLGVAFVVDAPDELFHYTKLRNFVSIIESGVLRATDAQQCNDSKEVIHGRERIAECLQGEVDRSMPGYPRRDFFKFFASNLISRVQPKYYVTCFSSRERGRLEWGQYADGGRGVVLVMNGDELAPSAKVRNSTEVVTCRPVTYKPSDQRSQLQAACDLAYRAIIRRLGPGKQFVRNLPFIASLGAILCSYLTYQAAAFKDEFWEDEHEWRIIVALYGSPSDANTVVNANGRSYIEVDYPNSKLPLTRVIVGPLASHSDESLVCATLIKHGYDVPVTRSDVPMR